jgi:succinate-semialdehyde dehydrogenase / glutarate-semialdehyde dehydrogenase
MAVERDKVQVVNPRTGAVDYVFFQPTVEEINAECRRLREAQQQWAVAPLETRVSVMSRWADEMEANREAIGAALAIDTGRWRPSMDAVNTMVRVIRGWCERAAGVIERALAVGRSFTMPHIELQQQLQPYALLGVISPWNFPLTLALIDAIPALVAGCAVIIKPSSVTPRFVTPLRATVARVPELAAVLSLVTGRGITGEHIIQNADMIVFTGSTETGRRVGMRCAERFIPAFLELGGKDPVIVTADADIERATTAVLRGSVFATGQICYSLERVYVDQRIHDRFVDRLVARAERIQLNHPDIRRGHIGPLIYGPQGAVIDDQIEDAIAGGAVIRTGGKSFHLDGGVWMRPTVVTDVNHRMKLMRDETFGPVMPVMAFQTIDEAVDLANDTDYGLSAAVIAGSREAALDIARRVDAGGLSVMDATLTSAIFLDAEKNSFRLSGLGGSRMGPASLLRFCRKKAIMINPNDPVDMETTAEELYLG